MIINNNIKTKFSINNINDYYSEIIIEPIEKGFGNTIGNSIRRVLLSYISGYSITELEINEVIHEYCGKNGIKEDIIDIILNIKEISIKLINSDNCILTLNKSEIGPVTVKDIKSNCEFKIYNEDHIICNITKNNIDLNIKMKVNKGYGYISNSEINDKYKNYNKLEMNKSNKIFIDSVFNPIEKAYYSVEQTYENYEKIIMKIKTNGSISCEEAFNESINILIYKLNSIINIKNDYIIKNVKKKNKDKLDNEIVNKNIDILDLTVRSFNCLKFDSINNIKDLIQKTENELLKIPNLGKKSLLEIKESLKKYNLTLNTKLNNK